MSTKLTKYLASATLVVSEPIVQLRISLASLGSCSSPGKSFFVGDIVMGFLLAALAATIAAMSAGPPPNTGPPDLLEASLTACW